MTESRWADVGEITVKPTDSVVEVGSFDLVEGADSLWVRMTNTGTPGGWPWSYGILSFKTEEGQPLGSIKAYNSYEGEVFRLGVGLPPSVRSGVLTFEPRGFNLAWVSKGNPWPLKFEAQSGSSSAVSSSYWNRDPNNGVLSPVTATDDVFIGNGNIELNADGTATYAAQVQCNALTSISLSVSRPTADSECFRVRKVNSNASAISLFNDGSATFIGHITAPNITFRSADPVFYKTAKGAKAETTYVGPELDLLEEISRLEALVAHLYETLRLTPPAGWDVWDGSKAVSSLLPHVQP